MSIRPRTPTLHFQLPLLAAIAFIGGCIPSANIAAPPPFETEELDSVLAVSVDLSGSFANRFSEQAYPLLLDVTDRFFRTGMGQHNRVVLSQMSGNSRVVLFDGTASELRSRFASPEELAGFLRSKSQPERSPIFDATRETIDYVVGIDGIGDSTRVLTVILSDMRESESDQSKRTTQGRKMLESLKRYREQGGAIACYCVDQNETQRWRRIFDLAGFDPGYSLISNDLVENPTLPTFD